LEKKSADILVFMDLDGTITRKDTLFAFIRYCFNAGRYYSGLARLAPYLAMNRVGLYPSAKAKELVLRKFFGEFTKEHFEKKGDEFSAKVLPGMIRKRAIKEIASHQSAGATIVVVTASLHAWCRGWCREFYLDLIATDFEVSGGKVTGSLQGKNCKGTEKVRRIQEQYDLKKASKIYAYGDSRSDLPMLGIADIKYYKWRIKK